MIAISVVIPCYNSELYIEETLSSLLNQRSGDIEIILIDDGSTDKTVELSKLYLKQFKGTSKVLRRPEGSTKGVSTCRNYGASVASGDWICFLDSDDMFHPEKIRVIREVISEYPSAKVIHHAASEFLDGTSPVFEIVPSDKVVSGINDIFSKMISRNIITTSGVVINKKLFNESGGFVTSLNGVEDYFFWLRISKENRWVYIDHKLTAYRVRNNSLMGGRSFSHYVTQSVLFIHETIRSNYYTESEIRKIKKSMFYSLGGYYSYISLNSHTYLSYVKGCWKLCKYGYVLSGLRYLFFRTRLLLLKNIVSFFRRK